MKLRRALVTAAATAAIAPLALLSAPAAFATAGDTASTETSATPEASPGESDAEATPPATGSASPEAPGSESPSAPATKPGGEKSPSALQSPSTSQSPSPSASTSAEPSGKPSQEPDEPEICEDSKVDVTFSGLPGEIAKGSGWHAFTLKYTNNSKSTITDLDLFAAVAPYADGRELFSSKQVALQVKNPETGVWEALDLDGESVDYLGYASTLKPDHEISIPLRLNVTSKAPVGAGFTLGAGVYTDTEDDCLAAGEGSYKFQIVAAGTDTSGTKPQEGGSIPVPEKKPAEGSVPEVTGSLAETGSDSSLPVIALAGGIAIVAGAGVVFALRRRGNSGSEGGAAA